MKLTLLVNGHDRTFSEQELIAIIEEYLEEKKNEESDEEF